MSCATSAPYRSRILGHSETARLRYPLLDSKSRPESPGLTFRRDTMAQDQGSEQHFPSLKMIHYRKLKFGHYQHIRFHPHRCRGAPVCRILSLRWMYLREWQEQNGNFRTTVSAMSPMKMNQSSVELDAEGKLSVDLQRATAGKG
jgi:hypothetical protein